MVSRIPSDFKAVLTDYFDFCLVNRCMRKRVVKDYYRMARRYITFCEGVVSEETVRAFLSQFLENKPKTYNNMLYGLRSFVGHYLNRMDIIQRFKRVWHSTELGELGVPDCYVDVFQGRAPKTMIARFYTGKELLRLKRIYDKAKLRVVC